MVQQKTDQRDATVYNLYHFRGWV